jgi:transposase InsO family protein
MKSIYPRVGLAGLCVWFGVTRQAYYQNRWRCTNRSVEEDLIIKEVLSIRKFHWRMGTRKLYEKLKLFMLDHQIKMGRDALFNLLSYHHLLVRKRKRRIQTTQSSHWLRKYPNLIHDYVPTSVNQLWVSDITYWKIDKKYIYISFITDAYSHKIVGYHVAETLEAVESVEALKRALSGLSKKIVRQLQLIHHSDRGIQYCSQEYVKLLQDYDIKISMTENGDPLENAIAERVNGIIKDEYLSHSQVINIKEAKRVLTLAVKLYNEDRPHMSIGNHYPSTVHEQNRKTEKLWKNYYTTKPESELLIES